MAKTKKLSSSKVKVIENAMPNEVKEETSKFAVDNKDLTALTYPNPVILGGLEQIGLKRISPIEIPKYLLMHPAVPKGIDIKVNRMVRLIDEDLARNVKINKTKSELAKEAAEYCKVILDNSGGPLFVKSMAKGAYGFGTSYSVLLPDLSETEIRKFEHQHEIFFGPAKYPTDIKKGDWGEIPPKERSFYAGKLKIDPQSKMPSAYTQFTKRNSGTSYDNNFKYNTEEYLNTRTHPEMKEASPGELIPFGEEIPAESVSQLAFDTLGDEPVGISLIQFLQMTICHLYNMEKGGAQAMINFGFNKWVANTPFKDETKMKNFGKSIANIQKDSLVVLPEGIDLKNIAPGTTEFYQIHPIYMKLIAMRLGIPMPLLAMDGTVTNKSTLDSQKEDMYEDFFADELVIERTINEMFFKACQYKWKDLTTSELNLIVPRFSFNQSPENMDKEMERTAKESLMVLNYSNSLKNCADVGQMDVVSLIAKRLMQILNRSLNTQNVTHGEFGETIEEPMTPTPMQITQTPVKSELDGQQPKPAAK